MESERKRGRKLKPTDIYSEEELATSPEEMPEELKEIAEFAHKACATKGRIDKKELLKVINQKYAELLIREQERLYGRA